MTSVAPNVHAIRPKQMNRLYKKQRYTVTFIPATKTWKWEVTVEVVTRYTERGESDTQIKAFRAAERFIDQYVKG